MNLFLVPGPHQLRRLARPSLGYDKSLLLLDSGAHSIRRSCLILSSLLELRVSNPLYPPLHSPRRPLSLDLTRIHTRTELIATPSRPVTQPEKQSTSRSNYERNGGTVGGSCLSSCLPSRAILRKRIGEVACVCDVHDEVEEKFE